MITQITQLDPSGSPAKFTLAGGFVLSTYNGSTATRSNLVYGHTDLGWQDAGGVESYSNIFADVTSLSHFGNGSKNTLFFSGTMADAKMSLYGGDDAVYGTYMTDVDLTVGSGNDYVDIANKFSDSVLSMESGDDLAEIFSISGSTVSLGSGDDGLNAYVVSFSEVSLGSGNDTFTVESYTDFSTITGGGGIQTVNLHSDIYGNNINLGGGNDTFNVFGRIDSDNVINMSGGDDTITGTFGVNGSTINTNWGNDTLVFGGIVQDSTILLGTGADTAFLSGLVLNTRVDFGGTSSLDMLIVGSVNSFQGTITGAGNGDIFRANNVDYVFSTAAGGFVNGSTILTF